MGLVVGTNSYVTAAEADTYFADRYGADAWSVLLEPNKESALVTALPLTDSYCVWSDDKTVATQALEFPRDGETEVPQSVKDAQCELALSIVVAGGPVIETEDALSGLRAGSVQLNWNPTSRTTSSIYNSQISMLLSPFCDSSALVGGSTARVVRT